MSKTENVKSGIVFKSMAGIALMLVFFSVVICAISFNGFTEALIDQYIADGAEQFDDLTMLCLEYK